ncbi:MAG: restriction endonuclease subunit S [Fluviicola sp.]
MSEKLPKDWVETELFDICTVITGKKDANFATEDGGYLFFTCAFEPLKSDSYSFEGEVLILPGNGANVGEVFYYNGKFEAYQRTYIVQKIRINPKFLYYYFKTNWRKYGVSEQFGSATNYIKIGNFKSFNVAYPPISEQQRIVAKLDHIFSHLETAKKGLEKIPVLLKQFRQVVLTQAVTGKLTEEWREDLKNITKINVDKKFKVEHQLIDYHELPETWEITALGNYVECSRGKFTARPRNDSKYFDGEFPFMQIGDLPREGGITNKFSKTLNEDGKGVSKSFPENTVVIAIVGATIGNTGILEKEMFFPDSLIGINAKTVTSNFFIEFYLRLCKNGLREISYAGGGQPNIKLPTITNLEIAIPPIEEQTEIVRRIEALFTKADAIEARYKVLKEKIDNLPQAVLAQAFRGEL